MSCSPQWSAGSSGRRSGTCCSRASGTRCFGAAGSCGTVGFSGASPRSWGWAGAERLLVEFVRAKDDRLLGPFTLAQVTSVLVMVAGVWVIARLRAPEAAPAVPTALTGTKAADDLARRH